MAGDRTYIVPQQVFEAVDSFGRPVERAEPVGFRKYEQPAKPTTPGYEAVSVARPRSIYNLEDGSLVEAFDQIGAPGKGLEEHRVKREKIEVSLNRTLYLLRGSCFLHVE